MPGNSLRELFVACGDCRMLPEFTNEGDLPVGVHRATLEETLTWFGDSSSGRRIVAARLRKIHHLIIATGHLARCVVFGSFVTNKDEPNDVDLIFVMDDSFDVSVISGEAALLFDHQVADSHFGARLCFETHPTGLAPVESGLCTTRRHRNCGVVPYPFVDLDSHLPIIPPRSGSYP